MAAAKPARTTAKQPASNTDYEKLAEAFAALANPIRLRILEVLITTCTCTTDGKCCVTDIHTQLDLPQPVVSKHLRVLKDLNILSYERDANKIYYSFTKANPSAGNSVSSKNASPFSSNLMLEIFSYISACCKCC